MLGLLRRPKPKQAASRPVRIQARFDAAQTTPENHRHWANADGLSADAAAMPEVRRVLRNRSRYEAENNSYAAGIISTLANDVIGTGPRIQLTDGDAEDNAAVEGLFHAWCERVGLAEKLRTMRKARATDGEAFCLLSHNPGLDGDVKIDLRLIEADQVATPDPTLKSDRVDGIVFDRFGSPAEYHVLLQHPGDIHVIGAWEYRRVPAEAMIHYYRVDRAGQSRGIPDITPALPLFAQLRRYTLAVIGAAELAADFAGTLSTDAPGAEGDEAEPFESIEIERRTMVTLPAGYKLSQLKAEQPSTAYAEFKREIINEMARCLDMPYNIAAANSSGYNYASGRLDHQTYFKAIRVQRQHLELKVLDRIFAAWFDEAVLVEGMLPQSMRAVDARPAHTWMWDGQEHVDPIKEAKAQAVRLKSHTTTLKTECARQGKDWEAVLRQCGAEKARLRELDLEASDASVD